MNPLEIHDVANIFPLMSAEEDTGGEGVRSTVKGGEGLGRNGLAHSNGINEKAVKGVHSESGKPLDTEKYQSYKGSLVIHPSHPSQHNDLSALGAGKTDCEGSENTLHTPFTPFTARNDLIAALGIGPPPIAALEALVQLGIQRLNTASLLRAYVKGDMGYVEHILTQDSVILCDMEHVLADVLAVPVVASDD